LSAPDIVTAVPLSGRARRRAFKMPLLPRTIILFGVLSPAMLLAGIFVDEEREPTASHGQLVHGTVIGVHREPGAPVSASVVMVRLDAADGTVICGLPRKDLRDGEIPALDTRIPIDYAPGTVTECTDARPPDELSPKLMLLIGVVAGSLFFCGIWFARPFTFGDWVEAWTRGYVGGGR
jgi:hypothetical protein